MRNAIFPKFTAYLCISGDEEVHMLISNVSDELARLNGFGNGIFDDSHVSHDLHLGFTSLSTSGMSQALCSLSETNSHAYGQCTTRHQKVVSEASPRDQYEMSYLIASLVLTQAHTNELRTKIVKILCIIFVTAMYASSLTIMSRVIKTKSVKYYMPILLSITNFLNGICWTIYAVIKFDMNIIIPNGLGAILGAVQLILYWWYYKTTNWDVNDDEGVKQEIQLPTKNTTILVETQ